MPRGPQTGTVRAMIRRHVTALRLLFMAADGLTAAGLFVVVSILRFGPDGWLAAWTAAGANGLGLALAYGVAWVVATWLLGLYRLRVRWSVRSELIDLIRADLLLAVATFARPVPVQAAERQPAAPARPVHRPDRRGRRGPDRRPLRLRLGPPEGDEHPVTSWWSARGPRPRPSPTASSCIASWGCR